MPHSAPLSLSCPPRPARRSRLAGMSIPEVMMATFVLALGIATSLTALQYGMRQVDTARNMTLAGQIMQSEIEILRLHNWAQIGTLQTAQASPTTATRIDPSDTITAGTSTSLDATLTTIANKFDCFRLIEDITGKTDMKKITLTVSWTGIDGREHNLRFQTRYARNGLSDYFYVAH